MARKPCRLRLGRQVVPGQELVRVLDRNTCPYIRRYKTKHKWVSTLRTFLLGKHACYDHTSFT